MSEQQTPSLSGKTAWVTGAAHGIGRACAMSLAGAGARVALTDMRGEMAEQVAQQIRSAGGEAQAWQSDVTDEADTRRAVSAIVERFGSLDVAFCNAGTFQNVPAEQMPLSEFERVIRVNLTGTFITARAAGRAMIEAGHGGSIILTASMSGHIVNVPQCQVAYNASKAGVIQLGKSLAVEWARHGIRVNTVSPGYIYTYSDEPIPPENVGKSDFERLTPLKRFGQPEELGALVLYLASDASAFVTGTDILIDGGYTAI